MAAIGVPGVEQAKADVGGLLVATGEGNREAFSLLFDLLSPVVHRTVYRVIRDPTLAQDVVQDVFLEVWQTSPRFDPRRGGAHAWVCTIARRRAIDRVRAVQASRDRDRRIGVRDSQEGYDSVWERIEIVTEHARVLRAMGQISDLQRECVMLVYAEGFSYAEISERLRVPVGTVKTRLRGGLARLRAVMSVD